MNDRLEDQHQIGAKPRHRARSMTIAGLVCLGLATGGIVAANAATTSGGSNSSSSGSGSSGAPAAPQGGAAMLNSYGIDGFVTSVSSGSLTVRDLFGNAKTYALSGRTTYHAGPDTKAGASSLTEGQHVSVRAAKSSGTLKATDVDIHAAHIDGSVTSVSGGVVTVTDNDGFTRQIDVTPGTDYTKNGTSSTSSSVTEGVVVHAEGKVDSDGTSLDAISVNVLTKAATPPGGPMGGPGAGGPGAGGPGAGGSGAGGPGAGGPGAGGPAAGGPAAPKGSGTSGKSGGSANGGPGNGSAPAGGRAPSGAASGAPSAPAAPSGAPDAPSGASTGNAGNGS